MGFVDLPTNKGSYWKDKELATAAALLIEPKSYDENGKSNYVPSGHINGSIPQIHARVTVFQTPEDVQNEKGNDLGVLAIQRQTVVRDLKDLVGSATAAVLVKLPQTSKMPHGAWVLNQPDDATRSHVVKFYTDREAADQAEMPDFLK